MPSNRAVEKEIAALKKEISALRTEYARAGRKTAETAASSAERLGAIKDDIVGRVGDLKDTLSEGASGVADDVMEQLDELRSMLTDYSDQAGKAVKAHPIATVAGAAVIGYLIGRLSR